MPGESKVRDFSNVEFINDEEQVYFSQAYMGEQVKNFFNSPVGAYLLGCAEQELAEIKEQLLELDPYSSEGRSEFKKLQADGMAARYFKKWLAEAISTGEAANYQLNQIAEQER